MTMKFRQALAIPAVTFLTICSAASGRAEIVTLHSGERLFEWTMERPSPSPYEGPGPWKLYTGWQASETITLATGDVAKVLWGYPASTVLELLHDSGVSYRIPSFPIQPIIRTSGASYEVPIPNLPVIAGPAQLRIPVQNSSPTAVTIEITRVNSTPAVTPGGAVVIPEDAGGPVEIIMESSVDMVTWTQANPGTYGASTARRFFRVRAVQHP